MSLEKGIAKVFKLNDDNRASKAVLGERVWANRDKIAVPAHHKVMPNILNAVSSLGMLAAIWGIVTPSKIMRREYEDI